MCMLSIITPNKNHLKGLTMAAESLPGQSFRNWEHLIMDSVSTDGSVEYARGRSQTRIVSEPDKSLEEALNKSIRLATGKYVTFLLGWDRYVAPDWLEKAINFLEENPHYSLVSASLQGFNGKCLNYHVYPSGEKFNYYFFIAPWPILQDAVFICRRSVLLEVFPDFWTTRNDCDIFHQLWINFFSAGYLARFFTDDVLEYSTHEDSRLAVELTNGNWYAKEHTFYRNKHRVREQILWRQLKIKFRDSDGKEIGALQWPKYVAALLLYKISVFILKKVLRRKISNFKFGYAQELARRCLDRVM
jgi:glycosyltransferase involved in cell wall biosynthesis